MVATTSWRPVFCWNWSSWAVSWAFSASGITIGRIDDEAGELREILRPRRARAEREQPCRRHEQGGEHVPWRERPRPEAAHRPCPRS